MFTSLLKIGLLSFITAIFPLKAVSSYNESTADNEINLKANKKELSYIPYNSDYVGYFGDYTKYRSAFEPYMTGLPRIIADFKVANSNFTTTNNTEFTYFDYMYFQSDDSNGQLTIGFGRYDFSANYYLMFAGSPSSSTYLVSQTFFMRGSISFSWGNYEPITDTYKRGLSDGFNTCFSSSYETITFGDTINYNAMYGKSLLEPYFSDSLSTVWDLDNKIIFECGGVFYDSILTGTGTAYDKNIQYLKPSFAFLNSPYGYEYINSSDYAYVSAILFARHYYVGGGGNQWNTAVTLNTWVNERGMQYSYDENNNISETIVLMESNFVNDMYKEIKVYKISLSDKTNLLSFNIKSQSSVSSGSNIALDTSFNLISKTLKGLTDFMGIIVLPGVSLGSLILIPFAITILLFVVRMFKR